MSFAGHAGTRLPQEWESKLQGSTGMNSGDTESIQWGRCARSMVKLGAMMERTRATRVQMIGRVDNDALRLAVERRSSNRLGILSRQGDVGFKFLKEAGLIPIRLPSAAGR